MSLSLTAGRARTNVYNITVVQADGTPANLTGSTLYFNAGSPGLPVFQKNSGPGGGITITNAARGLAQLQLEPGDTSPLPDGPSSYSCELSLSLSGEEYFLDFGTLKLLPNVTVP